MAFTLMDLPYAYDALEPHLDARTMEIHHSKHHAGYVAKLNGVLEGHDDLLNGNLVDILSNLDKVPASIRQKVINLGGGVYNHDLYFSSFSTKGGGAPVGELAAAINAELGGFEVTRKTLSDNAVNLFGSGWSWLVVKDGKLMMTTTQNQDCPLSLGQTPILTIDVWEHAYYLKFQQLRPNFVDVVWNVIDWNIINDRYKAAIA